MPLLIHSYQKAIADFIYNSIFKNLYQRVYERTDTKNERCV